MSEVLLIVALCMAVAALLMSALALWLCYLMALSIGKFKQDVSTVCTSTNTLELQRALRNVTQVH